MGGGHLFDMGASAVKCGILCKLLLYNACSCFSCGLKKAGRLKASWKRREEFSGIQVHTSMLLDHGPTRTIDYVTTFCDQVEPSVTMETDQMEDVATTP